MLINLNSQCLHFTMQRAPCKNGRVYGVGSIRKSLAPAPAQSSSSDSDENYMKMIIEEHGCLIKKQKVGLKACSTWKFQCCFDYLATNDSSAKTILHTTTMPSENSQAKDNHLKMIRKMFSFILYCIIF